MIEHDRFGGVSAVWAGIAYDGRTDLYVIRNGTLTGVRYRDEIFNPKVRPFAGACGPGFILMVDNARSPRARVVDQYLEQEDIDRIDWPARSPDLNHIENAWDVLQRRISARYCEGCNSVFHMLFYISVYAQVTVINIYLLPIVKALSHYNVLANVSRLTENLSSTLAYAEIGLKSENASL